jgi:phosphoribosylanthranilate isomerase
MFKIKICGITTPEDALLAAEAGADAIGLNFYEKSPRCITAAEAYKVQQVLPTEFTKVGVFVSIASDHDRLMRQIADLHLSLNFAAIQLHGDDRDLIRHQIRMLRVLSGLTGGNIMFCPAIRCSQPNLLTDDELSGLVGTTKDAILLDGFQPGLFGGTGQTLDWNMIREQRDKLLGLPLILAGGLTPDNVAEAIRLARPDAVDVASGVESSPGKKDPAKLRDFLAAAKEAFAKVGRSGP